MIVFKTVIWALVLNFKLKVIRGAAKKWPLILLIGQLSSKWFIGYWKPYGYLLGCAQK
jgi:hypothetical protein